MRGATDADVAGVAQEVDARRADRVRAVHQDSPTGFRIALEGDRRLDLVLELDPDFPRALLADAAPALGAPTPFAAGMRNLLAGARLESARAVPGERAMEVRFSLGGLARTVWFEGFARHANLYVLDERGVVAMTPRGDAAERRGARVGEPFAPVPPREATAAPTPDASARLARAAREASEKRAAEGARAALLRTVRGAERKAAALVATLERALAEEGDAATWRRRGDLLAASFHLLRAGLASVRVPDPMQDPPAEVDVPLEPGLEPGEQVAACYERERKTRRAAEEARARLPDAREAAAALAAALPRAEAADSAEALRALAEELGLGRAVSRPKAKGPTPAAPWRTYTSADGWPILVGRDARGNDVLTTKEARPWDLFLHVRGESGSHVIVPTPRGKTVPKETLLDAAELACHFSGRRNAERNEVDYVERRHVRKPRGAAPGLVQLDRSKTLSVRRDEARRSRLLGRRGPKGGPEPDE